jgi:phosphoribosylformylglycinamidine (FGAM) synthase-like enzyme
VLRAAARAGDLASVHDISEGGLACALAECCIEGRLGARVDPPRSEEELFGEAPGGAIVSGPRAALEAIEGAAVIGEVGGDALSFAGGPSVPVARLRALYEGAIPAFFAASVA